MYVTKSVWILVSIAFKVNYLHPNDQKDKALIQYFPCFRDIGVSVIELHQMIENLQMTGCHFLDCTVSFYRYVFNKNLPRKVLKVLIEREKY